MPDQSGRVPSPDDGSEMSRCRHTTSGQEATMTEFVCPDAQFHGNPFRYCGVKGCNWTEPVPESPDDRLRSEVKHLLNSHSRENVSNTPDHILADVMMDALRSFEAASNAREGWYGKSLSITDA